MKYDFQAIEAKWQQVWEERATYRVANPGEPGFAADNPKYYVLDMFPYPSGEGLHVGHPIGYIGTDIVARYKRMRGFNVLHPMGFDAFGLPAEQYAVETSIHPRITTDRNVVNFRRQLKAFGFSYDWSREIATTDVGYYRWTQWIFLQLFNSWFDGDRARPIDELEAAFAAGRPTHDGRGWNELTAAEQRRELDDHRLAYIAEVPVNWCPGLGTVLANEEVTNEGRSERGDFPVFLRPLRQWLLRITAYADRLVDDLDLLEWPESLKTMQRNWIGRSEGAYIDFPTAAGRLQVFTTRPDTVYGATFMVLAPEHPLTDALTKDDWPEGAPPGWRSGESPRAAVEAYRGQAAAKSEVERSDAARAKTGVFTGSYARNPFTDADIPIFVADYVLMGYGTGAIMGVPGQDDRDWEFAEAYGIPIVRTVQPPDDFIGNAYTGEGPAINSGILDGLDVDDAKAKIIEWLEENDSGSGAVIYRLRDWLFSRQRYWGEPIPILHGPDGDLIALAEDELPLQLPDVVDFEPQIYEDEDAPPVPALDRAADAWKYVERDGVAYTRELNTMPQWAGSCWYYLRYIDPDNPDRIADPEAEAYWMGDRGVDLYVGGVEHGVLHLLYARFWHKVLYDLGHVSTPEPFGRLFNQGYILADAFQDERGVYVPAEKVEYRDGRFWYDGRTVARAHGKMGKSLKNSVSPNEIFVEYGVDTLRLYEMFMGPLATSKPWTTRDIVGVHRFLQRVWRNFVDAGGGLLVDDVAPAAELERLMHRTVKVVTADMEALSFNTAIARLFELNNALVASDRIPRVVGETVVRLLAPFAPHLAEELWERLGCEGSVVYAAWPEYDDALATEEMVTMVLQVNGKVRDRLAVPADIDEEAAIAAALASERVQGFLDGGSPSKVIAVPPRLVNVVV